MRIALLLALVLLIAPGCTIRPVVVVRRSITFSGAARNGGLVGRLVDGRYEITPRARDHFNGLTHWYGAEYPAPIGEDYGIEPLANGNFAATPDSMLKFEQMNFWRLNGKARRL